jgi:MFS transporter, ACS family, D-galactonate transporter
LIAGGRSETRVRKTVLLTGMCAGLAVIGAAATRDPVIAIIWISIALSGLAAAAPVCWSLPSLIAPKGGVGTVGGIMNFANNMMGAAAPMVTGFVVGSTQSFANAFIVAAIVLLVGVAAFAFLLGRIEALDGPATST